MTLRPIDSFDDLALSDLRRLVRALIEQVGRLADGQAERDAKIAALQVENRERRDEIARLKGLPARPKFRGKPSGMEKATSLASGAGKGRSKRGRGAKRDKLEVTAEIVLKASPPPGSRFRGYEDILVQDLKIEVETVRYRRERWQTPSGERIVAPLPSGVLGGY